LNQFRLPYSFCPILCSVYRTEFRVHQKYSPLSCSTT